MWSPRKAAYRAGGRLAGTPVPAFPRSLPDNDINDARREVLWGLTSPELVDRFTRRRGWTLDRYERWVAQTMADALVGPLTET
jgi:hypothetical protein